MGMRPKRSGGVVIAGRNVTDASPREIIELGVGHVPEDRGKHGVVGSFTIADNLVLNRYRRGTVRPPRACATTRPSSATPDDAREGVRRPHAQHEGRRPTPSRAATSRR